MRILFFILVFFISFNLFSQPVVTLKNGAGFSISSGTTITVNGGISGDAGASILNNGIIKLNNNSVANQSNWTDQTTSGILNGIGSVIFQSSFPQSISGPTNFYTLEINNAGIQLPDNTLRIQNKLILKNGKVGDAGDLIQISNTDANAVEAAGVNSGFLQSYVLGSVERAFTANTDTYIFPVGGNAQANPLHFVNRNLSGYSQIKARFSEPKLGTDEGLMVFELGTPYTAVKSEGVWLLNPTGTYASGQYDLLLFFNGFSSLADNQFAILRRPDESSSGADWIVPAGSVLPPNGSPGRMVADGYARRNNLTTFSQFGIGITSDPLPLNLLSFRGRTYNHFHLLSWETADEVNTDQFILERSSSSTSRFSPLVYVKAKGSYSQTNFYQITDSLPLQGDNFYRLKMIDQDAAYRYSSIIRLRSNDKSLFSIYPNPISTGQLQVVFKSAESSTASIQITDHTGRVLIQKYITILSGMNQYDVPVHHLPSGLFNISVLQNGKKSQTSSFIRQ